MIGSSLGRGWVGRPFLIVGGIADVGVGVDKSFVMATTAWSLDVLLVGALVLLGVSGLVREDDYSRIEE